MPLKDSTSSEIQCQGREARITSRTQSRRGGKRVSSSHKSKDSEGKFNYLLDIYFWAAKLL